MIRRGNEFRHEAGGRRKPPSRAVRPAPAFRFTTGVGKEDHESKTLDTPVRKDRGVLCVKGAVC